MDIKITFGIIVLNGEPFTRYCIRALYPYAYEIIVAEGACEGARNVATGTGHSTDDTLIILKELKEDEDPENKIVILTAEDEGHPNGFWPGEKLEQCQAFAKRATGNYLWQVDIDEFYLDEDIEKVKKLLNNNQNITCLSFKQYSFWGGFQYLVDSWYFKRYLPEIIRIFKWEEGSYFTSHRPPTVFNKDGKNLREINFLNSKQTSQLGIFIYHYSFVFPKQVSEKAQYYKNAEWSKRKDAEWWANDVYLKLSDPYKVFSISWIPSWLIRFKREHPKTISHLKSDIDNGLITVKLRDTHDIEDLLKSFSYRTGILYLKILEPIDRLYNYSIRKSKSVIKKILF
jgi:hypothetical protein